MVKGLWVSAEKAAAFAPNARLETVSVSNRIEWHQAISILTHPS